MDKVQLSNLVYNYNFYRVLYFVMLLVLLTAITTISGGATTPITVPEDPY